MVRIHLDRPIRLVVAAALISALVAACTQPITNPDGLTLVDLPSKGGGYQEEVNLGPASAGLVNGVVPTVHLSGSPRDVGRQHGTLLATKINEILDGYVLPYAESRGGRDLFDLAGEVVREHLTEAELEELEGIAEGSGRSLDDILLLNAFFDAASVLAGREGHTIPLQGAVMGVSNMAMYTNAPVLGGTFETEIVGVRARPETIVFVYHPSVGKPYICVSYPGMLGAYAGMNLDGVSLIAAAVPGPLGLKPTAPFSVLCRRLLANADTVEVAMQHVLESDISTSHVLTMADNQGRVWQMECSVERIVVRKNARNQQFGTHVLFGSNHFVDDAMEGQQAPPTVASLQRMDKLNEARVNLNDYFWRPNTVINAIRNATIRRNLASSVLFFPNSHTLYVSTASDRNEAQPYHQLPPHATYGILRPELAR